MSTTHRNPFRGTLTARAVHTIIYETFQNFNCIYNSIPTYKKPFRDANYGWPTSTSLDDLYNTITTVAGFRLALENLCGRYSST